MTFLTARDIIRDTFKEIDRLDEDGIKDLPTYFEELDEFTEEVKATGLYYYGARYYDPVLGRFISPDSIVPDPSNPQAFNRYSYVINNPLLYIDPTGHGFTKWLRKKVINPLNDWIDKVFDLNEDDGNSNVNVNIYGEYDIYSWYGAGGGSSGSGSSGGGGSGGGGWWGGSSGGGSSGGGSGYESQLNFEVTGYSFGPSYRNDYEIPWNDRWHAKFIPYTLRLFEDSQYGGGAGGGVNVAFGPVKGSAAAYDIQGKRLGPDGWKYFREQKIGVSLKASSYSYKIDIKDGKFGGGFSYKKISTTDALRFSIGGTIPNPYSGAAVHFKLNVNLGEAFNFKNNEAIK